MESAAKTNTFNRELTPTEIQISLAEIQDRLTRVAKAQRELECFLDDILDKTDDQGIVDDAREKKEKHIREKYNIPEEVYLFGRDVSGALIDHRNGLLLKYIKEFIRGKLSKDQMGHLYFYLDEIEECDYGWILIDSPMSFYNRPGDGDIDKITEEIFSIGTRNKEKHKPLKELFSFRMSGELKKSIEEGGLFG